MSEGMEKRNVLKDDFGWEVPVDNVPLPSKGAIYDPDSRLFNKEFIKIKAMTAREEDILSSRALLQEGTAIKHLIKSCLIDKDINIDELTSGDKDALLVSIRITGYGSDYHVSTNCESCGFSNDVTVDLSELEIKRLSIKPVEEGQNKFRFTLPVSKKVVIFKFLNSFDYENIAAKIKFSKNKLGMKIEGVITLFLEEAIISIDNIKEKHKIKKFVDNMPAYDSRALRDYIAENEPRVIMEHSFKCSNCDHDNTSSLPMKQNFFWPSR